MSTVKDLGKLYKKNHPGKFDDVANLDLGIVARDEYPQYKKYTDMPTVESILGPLNASAQVEIDARMAIYFSSNSNEARRDIWKLPISESARLALWDVHRDWTELQDQDPTRRPQIAIRIHAQRLKDEAWESVSETVVGFALVVGCGYGLVSMMTRRAEVASAEAGKPMPQPKPIQEESELGGCLWKLIGVGFVVCLIGLVIWSCMRFLRWAWDTPLFGS